MVRTIIGANWGDEGKGKITDVLAEKSDIVVRFQGGANAGHTIINSYGKFALHLMPSGAFHQNIMNIIGPGVALNIESLLKEYDDIVARGVPAPQIMISDRVQVMMPYHVDFDKYEEERLGKNSFGSTKSGIAPFYGDKYMKIGMQICQIYDKKLFRERLENVAAQKNVLLEKLYGKEKLDVDALFEKMTALAERVRPWVGDTGAYLRKALKEGKTVLLEGQLGTLRDPDHGIYPFTTSSSPLAGYGPVGAGISPKEMSDIIAVTKAYSSCVGAGPFTTELFGDEAEELRRRGGDAGEYGATTHRPRRVGWFDAVATRYGVLTQGATEVALTNLDVLGYLDEIKVCTAYEYEGRLLRDFPVTPVLEKCKPVYTTVSGWGSDVRGITKYSDLPEKCRAYVDFIEKEIEVPIKIVSNGPRREETMAKE